MPLENQQIKIVRLSANVRSWLYRAKTLMLVPARGRAPLRVLPIRDTREEAVSRLGA